MIRHSAFVIRHCAAALSVLLLASSLRAQEPAYPESAAAKVIPDVEKVAIPVQVVHQEENCAGWRSDPPRCANVSHYMYWIGKEGFKCAERRAGADPRTPLSEDFARHIVQAGKEAEDKDRPGLSTATLLLYADRNTPCCLVEDVMFSSAAGGRIWRQFIRCSGGLLDISFPVDRGEMPALGRETVVEARVGVFLDPDTHKVVYKVFAESAADTGELEKALQKVMDRLKERFPTVSFPLVLEASPDAPFSALVDAITIGRKVGFQQVQLARAPAPK